MCDKANAIGSHIVYKVKVRGRNTKSLKARLCLHGKKDKLNTHFERICRHHNSMLYGLCFWLNHYWNSESYDFISRRHLFRAHWSDGTYMIDTTWSPGKAWNHMEARKSLIRHQRSGNTMVQEVWRMAFKASKRKCVIGVSQTYSMCEKTARSKTVEVLTCSSDIKDQKKWNFSNSHRHSHAASAVRSSSRRVLSCTSFIRWLI